MAIGLGAAVIGTAALAVSGSKAGRRNLKTSQAWQRKEREDTQDWKEKMRANQYQVATQDMKDAGINPMVAYQQGGAGNLSSSPGSGGSAQDAGDYGQVANSAVSALKLRNENKIASASVNKINAETNLSNHQAKVSSALAAKYILENKILDQKQIRIRKYGASAVGNLIDTTVQTWKSTKRGAGNLIREGVNQYRKAGKFAKPPKQDKKERRRQRRSRSQIEENKARANRNKMRGKK